MVAERGRAGSTSELEITVQECRLLSNRLIRFTCSDPWRSHLLSLIVHKQAPYREKQDAQERALCSAGVYPPGGRHTLMRRCRGCKKKFPPQYIGTGRICAECFYGNLPLWRMVQLPSSPSIELQHRWAQALDDGLSAKQSRRRFVEKFKDPSLGNGWGRGRVRDMALAGERSGDLPSGRQEGSATLNPMDQWVEEDGFLYEAEVIPPDPAPKQG